jgi:hypothetical protein
MQFHTVTDSSRHRQWHSSQTAELLCRVKHCTNLHYTAVATVTTTNSAAATAVLMYNRP